MPVPTLVDLTPWSSAGGGSARLTGHLARPDGPGPWPGVVIVHEAFGVDDVMLRQAQRLAQAGYLALLPDLFTDGGARRCLIPTLRAILSGRGRVYADASAARTALAERPDCTGRIGIIGFCMGGSFALMAAGRGIFDVASVNYGHLPRHAERVLAGACPIVASFGRRDVMLRRGTAARLQRVLDRLGVTHDVREYPDAGHSFLNDAEAGPRALRPLMRVAGVGPEPASAGEAWRRIEAFFDTHLWGP